jgi:hypothetical protein
MSYLAALKLCHGKRRGNDLALPTAGRRFRPSMCVAPVPTSAPRGNRSTTNRISLRFDYALAVKMPASFTGESLVRWL